MNLHEIVSGAINSINPFQTITITPRSSYKVDEYGEATPNEGASYQIQAQIQPLTSEDIKFINSYNESTIYKAFWVSANTFGLNRPMAKGGDKVVWDSQIYYVTSMPEDWYETSGWSHFIGALQLTPESEENNANT